MGGSVGLHKVTVKRPGSTIIQLYSLSKSRWYCPLINFWLQEPLISQLMGTLKSCDNRYKGLNVSIFHLYKYDYCSKVILLENLNLNLANIAILRGDNSSIWYILTLPPPLAAVDINPVSRVIHTADSPSHCSLDVTVQLRALSILKYKGTYQQKGTTFKDHTNGYTCMHIDMADQCNFNGVISLKSQNICCKHGNTIKFVCK